MPLSAYVGKSEQQFPRDTVGCLSAHSWPTVFAMLQTKVSADHQPTVGCLLVTCQWPVGNMSVSRVLKWPQTVIYRFNNYVKTGKINCREIVSMATAYLACIDWRNMLILVQFNESFWVTCSCSYPEGIVIHRIAYFTINFSFIELNLFRQHGTHSVNKIGFCGVNFS